MKKIILTMFLAATALLSGCGFGSVQTGEVGLRTHFNGKLSESVEPEGLYTAWLSSVDRYTIKEVAIPLENLKPKAKDNLSLQELDVSVFYRVNPGFVRNLAAKRAGQSIRFDPGFYAPSYAFVESVARSEIADVVSRHDSLTIHQDRTVVENEAQKQIQANLDASDPGAFVVSRVVVRQVLTDPSVEASIRNVVAKGKELEAANLQVRIAQANAEATAKTAQTLTPAFLQHEYNQALMKFAEKGGTVILDGSSSSKQFIVGR